MSWIVTSLVVLEDVVVVRRSCNAESLFSSMHFVARTGIKMSVDGNSLAYILGSPAAAAPAARGLCEVFYIIFLQGGLLYYTYKKIKIKLMIMNDTTNE